MPAPPWFRQAVASVRAANPYVVDATLAVLVLFAATPRWMFVDEDGAPLSRVGRLLAADHRPPAILVGWIVGIVMTMMRKEHAERFEHASPTPESGPGGLATGSES